MSQSAAQGSGSPTPARERAALPSFHVAENTDPTCVFQGQQVGPESAACAPGQCTARAEPAPTLRRMLASSPYGQRDRSLMTTVSVRIRNSKTLELPKEKGARLVGTVAWPEIKGRANHRFWPIHTSPTSSLRKHARREPCCWRAPPQALRTIPHVPESYPRETWGVRQNPGDTDPTAQRRRHGAARALEMAPFSTKALCMGLGLLPEVHPLCLCTQGHWHPESPFCLQGWGLWGLSEPGFSPTLPLRLTCTVTRGWGVRVREECSRPHRGSTRGGSTPGHGAGAAAAGRGGVRGHAASRGSPAAGFSQDRASED